MVKVTSLLKWRESASLVILAKDSIQPPSKGVDYSILLFKRTSKSSFMPNSYVFPGGVLEKTDNSPLWLDHIRSFGVDDKLRKLSEVSGQRPSIYTKTPEDAFERDISLRITAIRETFEEMGVLCCRNRKSIKDQVGFGHTFDDFDKEHWQQLVHNDSSQFLKLCQEHDIIPDLWSLHEWSAWLTPSNGSNRFQTAFYLVALQNKPEVVMEKHEAVDYLWKSPLEYIASHLNKELWLPPPQFYELSRLANFNKLHSLCDFARERSSKGVTLMLPVQYACTDGRVSLLPGDDMYPEDPNAPTEVLPTNSTIEEFRKGAKKIHRAEFRNKNSNRLLLNFDLPNGHMTPINFSKE